MTIAWGVPAGAIKACSASETKPGKPEASSGHDVREKNGRPVVYYQLLSQRPCKGPRDEARREIVAASGG
ncbi:MAG: hypothetical protein AAB325_05440 [Pseudomonadota bacterium]